MTGRFLVSLSAANSDDCDSFLVTFSRGPTPHNYDSPEKSSGSGGHPPPVPIFDLFFVFPISLLDKAVDSASHLTTLY
jgi:hypothetical protein